METPQKGAMTQGTRLTHQMRKPETMEHMMNDGERILDGLDEAQTMAAKAVNGPVRIVAGAGAGKTRTITRRIAYACATGVWNPQQSLAVTFSVKAAAQMRSRLAALGVQQVHAATFHSAALRQIRRAWPQLTDAYFPQVASDQRPLIVNATSRVVGVSDPDPLQIRALQAEINWTKVSLIAPEDYPRVCAATHRLPPMELTPERMADVITAYEQEKSARNQIDFNDILLMTCHVLESFNDLADEIRSQTRWITVDEYQDVSPLQHRLLQLWLGKRNSLCVVGDPAQTIYSFTGATSYYLLHFAEEFKGAAADIRLTTDYRSTPQIVRYANRVLAASPQRGDYLSLSSARPTGRRVMTSVYDSDEAEAQGVANRIGHMVARGVNPSDIAVLMRINAQGRLIRKALAEQRISSAVRSDMLQNAATVLETGASAQQVAQIVAGTKESAVTISTIHAAKGLEFKHVFLIGCTEGLMPFGSPEPGDVLEEERRLFYVGVTRGEDTVDLSFASSRDGAGYQQRTPSRFLMR